MTLRWLEMFGWGVLAFAAEELPRLVDAFPEAHWIGGAASALTAIVAFTRLSPAAAAELDAAKARIDVLAEQLGKALQ
ncbi:MAG TPA: hypothetical protein VMI75_21605 [Polyangiaceae bacterium]|nr:hypothetical protein [Polyangiaceae bacterium]